MKRGHATRKIQKHIWIRCCLFVPTLVLHGCGDNSTAQKSEPPAKVQNAVKESELATITLTAEAQQRLGIALSSVEMRRVQRARTFGGEVVPVPGREAAITAPIAGRVEWSAQGGELVAGASVANGAALFRLYPLPTGQDLMNAREAERQAQIRLDAATQRAKRAEQLLKDRAGSVRAVEEANNELASASAALDAARARIQYLTRETRTAPAAITPLAIVSPFAGILTELRANAGQEVAAGALLARVVNMETVLIRVPVYVGEYGAIESRASAQVTVPGETAAGKRKTAESAQAPPSADANAASVDLHYRLANSDGWLRPGQRVEVSLPLKDAEMSLTVPWAAVLYDIYGGSWVYTKTAEHVYVRRRVEVRYVVGALAVLARGPSAGTRVVTAGAAELFGTEFSTGK